MARVDLWGCIIGRSARAECPMPGICATPEGPKLLSHFGPRLGVAANEVLHRCGGFETIAPLIRAFIVLELFSVAIETSRGPLVLCLCFPVPGAVLLVSDGPGGVVGGGWARRREVSHSPCRHRHTTSPHAGRRPAARCRVVNRTGMAPV